MCSGNSLAFAGYLIHHQQMMNYYCHDEQEQMGNNPNIILTI